MVTFSAISCLISLSLFLCSFCFAPLVDSPAALVQDMERRRAFMDQQRAVQPLAREAKNVSVVMKSGGAAAAKLTSEQLAALPEFSSVCDKLVF